MIKTLSINKLLTLVFLTVSLFFAGCEKKNEQQQAELKTESISTDTISSESEPGVSEPVVEVKVSIPDIKGTYTGTLHNRPTTLKITDQTDSSFSGEITINYREVMNQNVKGTFSPSTMKFSMSDQIHSRYMGKYKGKISIDSKNLSGTFYPDYDKQEASFNLKKK
jgi:predicted membrane protein